MSFHVHIIAQAQTKVNTFLTEFFRFFLKQTKMLVLFLEKVDKSVCLWEQAKEKKILGCSEANDCISKHFKNFKHEHMAQLDDYGNLRMKTKRKGLPSAFSQTASPFGCLNGFTLNFCLTCKCIINARSIHSKVHRLIHLPRTALSIVSAGHGNHGPLCTLKSSDAAYIAVDFCDGMAVTCTFSYIFPSFLLYGYKTAPAPVPGCGKATFDP